MVSSLLYYANWHQIIANHSYFNLMGNPSLLQHTWSLAVEEQFYIVWPLLLVPGLVLVGRKRLPMIVIAGIAASAALMWILYTNPNNPSRVYYGTDTRAFLLLMGILLALVWPRIERLGRRALPLLELLGIAALVGSVLLFLQMHDFNPTLYQGGDLAAAFCFTVLIAAVAHPRLGIGQALGVAPLRWIGERSYGIYLWHWPIILLVAGVNARPSPGVVVGEAAIVVAAAALSYRYVEQPIRTRGLQRWLSQYSRRFRLEVVGAGALRPRRSLRDPVRDAELAESGRGLRQPDEGERRHPSSATGARSRVSHHTGQTQKKASLPPGRILALGDSVMLGCSSELRTALHHHVRVDATVGRQIEDTVNELQRLRRHHHLPKSVVIQVGNNGPALVPRPRAATPRAARDPADRRRQRPQRNELAGRVESRARQLAARLAGGPSRRLVRALDGQDDAGRHAPVAVRVRDLLAVDRRHAAGYLEVARLPRTPVEAARQWIEHRNELLLGTRGGLVGDHSDVQVGARLGAAAGRPLPEPIAVVPVGRDRALFRLLEEVRRAPGRAVSGQRRAQPPVARGSGGSAARGSAVRSPRAARVGSGRRRRSR